MLSQSSPPQDKKKTPLPSSRPRAFAALAATGFIALLMIFLAYRFIDIVGGHFIFADNAITVHSRSVGESYIFYSQSDSAITLYPWEYYDANADNYENYISKYDDASQGELFWLRDYYDDGNLYDQLRYHFYQSVPEIKPTILRSYGSLYELMNYNGILRDLSVSYANHQYFYYYQKDLKIDKTAYRLSFALNSQLELLSFRCIPITEYPPTEAEINLAKNRLTKLINDNYCNSFTLLLYDILYQTEVFENYQLTAASDSSNTFYLNRELLTGEIMTPESDDNGSNGNYNKNSNNSNYNLTIYDQEGEHIVNTAPLKLEKDVADVVEQTISRDAETIKEIADGLSQTQIVANGDDLLVVLPNLNLVLHFAPDTNTFTGFNRINS